MAKIFLSKGYTVISAVRTPEKQEALAAEDGAKHIIVRLDVNEAST
jgi:NADP-dependent 3-hydroxy acid dehydrogenase YdfG